MLMQPGQARALFVLLIAIGLAPIASAAEPSDTPDAASQPAAQERPYTTHATESIEACMAKWDPGTHMSKEQWRETCQRIKDEREPYVRGR